MITRTLKRKLWSIDPTAWEIQHQFDAECPPVDTGRNFRAMLRSALNVATYNRQLKDRELETLNRDNVVTIRQDGSVISAELFNGHDWYQFQIVLQGNAEQRIGEIVG